MEILLNDLRFAARSLWKRPGFSAIVIITLALGIGAALLLTRAIKSFLFGVSPTDPLTFLAISGLLLLTALIASLIPARRATKVDPLVALHSE